jgi:hypothetical protein
VNKRYTLALLFLTLCIGLLATESSATLQFSTLQSRRQSLPTEMPTIVNVDGDVALAPEQNRIYWNPHSTGLTNASAWRTTFENETEIYLRTTDNEAGHVATGAWWTTSFKTHEKLPLFTSKPVRVVANFSLNIVEIDLSKGNEWLRIALACAVQRTDGQVVYTESDVWDSSAALSSPSSNLVTGGNIVYRGGDVVEYKIDQATVGKWTNYSIELTKSVDSAWSLKSGDVLESAYIVVEAIGSVSATVAIDSFWLMKLT